MSKALYDAAHKGDVETLRQMIARGEEVNSTAYGIPPLIGAASGGHPAAVRLLLDHGADPNAMPSFAPNTSTLSSALHWAAMQLHAEMAELLLENGANIEARNRAGMTPLAVACATIPLPDPRDRSWDPDEPFSFSTREQVDTIRTFLRYGADTTIRTHRGQSLLDLAQGNDFVIALLRSRGI